MNILRDMAGFCAFLIAAIALGQEVPVSQGTVPSGQALTIGDARLREEIAAVLEDYERVSPAFKDEAQALKARLQQTGGPFVLTGDEQAQLSAILRTYKGIGFGLYAAKVDLLLISLGDSESIITAVKLLSEGTPLQRLNAPRQFERSRHPKVVAAVAGNLLVDESPQSKLIGDLRLSPQSIVAMHIMHRLLAESDAFPEAVNEWARSLHAVKEAKRRELVRSWWNINKEAMQKGDYRGTRPLSDEEQALQPGDTIEFKPVRRTS